MAGPRDITPDGHPVRLILADPPDGAETVCLACGRVASLHARGELALCAVRLRDGAEYAQLVALLGDR